MTRSLAVFATVLVLGVPLIDAGLAGADEIPLTVVSFNVRVGLALGRLDGQAFVAHCWEHDNGGYTVRVLASTQAAADRILEDMQRHRTIDEPGLSETLRQLVATKILRETGAVNDDVLYEIRMDVLRRRYLENNFYGRFFRKR